MEQATIPAALVSGTSSDSHAWNLVFLGLLLEEWGFDVVNLGVCVPDETLLAACLDRRPELVAIGTLNGHGHRDGARVVRKLRAIPSLAGTTVVIGGQLGVAGPLPAGGRHALLSAGFDGVFEGAAAIEDFRAFLGCKAGRSVLSR
jgi:methylaspartate mutase sigma subunit